MTAGALTSDHVNYLVWRYLQEAGYGESAVKLQRDWNLTPQGLPFAQYIKTHALVSLVQKGLQYHKIEQSIDKSGNRIQPSPSTFFFGPDSGGPPLPPRSEHVDRDSVNQSLLAARKHGRDSDYNGQEFEQPAQPPAKKSRTSKSNGAESIEANQHVETMEIDPNGYPHTEPSPKVDTPAPSSPAAEAAVAQDSQEPPEPEPTPTLTNGTSVGVQCDKVVNLGPETTLILDLDGTQVELAAADDATVNGRVTRDGASMGPEGGSVIVTHLAWNPRIPALLAMAGDKLSRIRNFTDFASTSENGHMDIDTNTFDDAVRQDCYIPRSQQRNEVNLLTPPEHSLVTACSWSPDGETLAVATRDYDAAWEGEIAIWRIDGRISRVLPAAHDFILTLQWNIKGTLLLGVATNGTGGTILVWDSLTGRLLNELTRSEDLKDAAWINEEEFVCCGDSIMIRGRVKIDSEPPAIIILQDIKSETHWINVKCDIRQDVIAAVAEGAGLIGIACGFEGVVVHEAHDESITSFEFRPIPKWFTETSSPSSQLLTSSTDGCVRLWKVDNSFVLVQQFTMDASVRDMVASFSPDGALVAAASYRRLIIWNADKSNLPIAWWIAATENWPTDEEAEEDEKSQEQQMAEDGRSAVQHTLRWHADGDRLAYGLGSQVAIINTQQSQS